MSFLSGMFESKTSYKNISSEELEALIKEKGADALSIVDVRTKEEHLGGHIPGSVNYNVMDPSFSTKIESLDKDTPQYVYCASGNRSKTASSLFVSKGFKEVYNLSMGMMGWGGDIA